MTEKGRLEMPALGTRTRQGDRQGREAGSGDTRSHTRDVGMAKRVSASITFTASDGRATGANGTFTSTFAAGDPVLVQGGLSNNGGVFQVTALDAVNAAYLVLSPAPKDEGPVTVTLRTP